METPCIELIRPRLRMEFTVAEYDSGIRKGRAVGSLDPLVPGHIGLIEIKPDGSRRVARAVPDPLAEQKPD
jgi:hypothetical protein